MYIVAIAWLYVVILMAVMQPTFMTALGTLFGYGLLPLALLVWVIGTPQRRRTRAARDATKPSTEGRPSAVSDEPNPPDHQHTQRDQ